MIPVTTPGGIQTLVQYILNQTVVAANFLFIENFIIHESLGNRVSFVLLSF